MYSFVSVKVTGTLEGDLPPPGRRRAGTPSPAPTRPTAASASRRPREPDPVGHTTDHGDRSSETASSTSTPASRPARTASRWLATCSPRWPSHRDLRRSPATAGALAGRRRTFAVTSDVARHRRPRCIDCRSDADLARARGRLRPATSVLDGTVYAVTECCIGAQGPRRSTVPAYAARSDCPSCDPTNVRLGRRAEFSRSTRPRPMPSDPEASRRWAGLIAPRHGVIVAFES